MQIVARDYFQCIGDINTWSQSGECWMYSSVTGCQIQPNELGAANSLRHLTSPVQFAAAIHDMIRTYRILVNTWKRLQSICWLRLAFILRCKSQQLRHWRATVVRTCMPYETVLKRDDRYSQRGSKPRIDQPIGHTSFTLAPSISCSTAHSRPFKRLGMTWNRPWCQERSRKSTFPPTLRFSLRLVRADFQIRKSTIWKDLKRILQYLLQALLVQ